ncbi:restriction endonuclease subunit S [Methylomonas sp. ZR1]|nr:restriction endonuclease subunit S [Methylomonas sp. ZR1]
MSAIQQLLTEHLDLWTAADTVKKSGRGRGAGTAASVYGIKKLRELILELAVRGKLVPQDANDEPACELLKRIQAEKARLIAEGKINKDKPPAAISEDEKPFELPEGWEWVQFGEICGIERGGSPRPIKSFLTDAPEGLNWIKIGDTEQGGKYITSSSEKITRDGLSKTRMVYPGDFLLTNSMSFGRPYITKIEGCIHDGWLRISPPESLNKDYLYSLLSSPYVFARFKAAAAGAVVMNLNSEKVRELFIPLPPFAEQHRIATKVDELMALCDQLETRHINAADAHEKLVSHLLGTLTSTTVHPELVEGPLAKDAAHASTSSAFMPYRVRTESFAENWQRIAAHFDTLFTTEASIDALKQTLLQLAVMGKLVPQDPNDEPASELLKRYGISSTASFTAGWSKVPLGKLGDIYSGATPSKAKPEYWVGNIPWISPKDMKRFYINDAEDNVSESAISETNLKLVPAGSLLVVVRGMILAHSFPVALTTSEVTINQDMKALVLPEEIKEFTLLYMRAMKNSFVALVDRSSHGTCKLVSAKLWTFIVEYPPLAEQHRIVAKVEELMALCDQLKARLAAANQLQQKLADGMVERAIMP